jgi:hypothetical protein
MLKRRCLHLIERQRVEGLFRAHVEAIITDRSLVVLVDKVISLDIVDGHGSGGISSRGHSEKFDAWCDGREERKKHKWVGVT